MASVPGVKVDLDFTPMFDKLELLASTFADMGQLLQDLATEILRSVDDLKGE